MVQRQILFLFVTCILTVSCGPLQRGLFSGKRSAHHQYGEKIRKAELDQTELGSLWFIAADKSLAEPLSVTTPHKETGYFPAEEPMAAGWLLDLKRGATLTITVSVVPVNTQALFVELWQKADSPDKPELLAAADSTLQLKYEVKRDGQYIVRLQPELLHGVEYTLTLITGPSLAFPVSESGKPALISFWSDPRDGGARSHEGVDIKANFRTPVVAVSDGYVQRVTDNRLGGKVVFVRPDGKDYVTYYAHLDTQLVHTGQRVKLGEVVGLIGNTGNAKNTVPHLHFGIYAIGGAIDPLPFIRSERMPPEDIKAPLNNLNKWLRTTSAVNIYDRPSTIAASVGKAEPGTALKVLSATKDFYKIALPDQTTGFVRSLSLTNRIFKTIQTDTLKRLLDEPQAMAAARLVIDPCSTINVVGRYLDYYLVDYNGTVGWISF